MGKVKEDTRPLGSPRSWARTPGTMIAGRQAHIDNVDHSTPDGTQMGRRAAPSAGLARAPRRVRRAALPAQCRHLARRPRSRSPETSRMAATWMALERASRGGPRAWCCASRSTGGPASRTAAWRQSCAHRKKPTRSWRQERKLAVYTLGEIDRILSHHSAVTKAKVVTFPGATVRAVRRPVPTPSTPSPTRRPASTTPSRTTNFPFFGA